MIKSLCVAMGLATIMLGQNPITQTPTLSEANSPSETTQQIIVKVQFEPNYHEYIETEDANQILNLMSECQEEMKNAHLMAEAARGLGYEEDHPIIQLAKKEYNDAKFHYVLYENKYVELGWKAKKQEYPEATEIWLYLKDLGYNDYVCAGILGNIMAEVGGNTLDIDPMLFSKDCKFYGMCQWSIKYYPTVKNLNLKKQCEYLKNNIEEEINIFGRLYKNNFDYEEFIALTSSREAAYAFAKTYERCAPQHYSVRQDNAEIAYKYFVN